MVISSMQGVNPDLRPRETILNGKVLSGKEEESTLEFLANIIGARNLKFNNKINKWDGKYRYVYIKHPIKDIWGRTRVTLIFWEYGTVTQDDIEATVETSGIDKREYRKAKENSRKKFIIF